LTYFYKIRHGEGVPGPYHHAKVHGCGFKNVGFKIAKIYIFLYKFSPKGYIPLPDFYKSWHGGGSPRPAPSCQISLMSLLKCGLTTPKIEKNRNFGYKSAQNGYIPLSDFYQIWLGKESLKYAPSCQISLLCL